MGHKIFVLPANERYILLGAILLVWLIVRGIQFFSQSRFGSSRFGSSNRGSGLPLGTARDYGIAGGAVCPKCHRPFSLGLMAIKFGLGTRLARCEFCGKWSVVRRASLAELRAAEAAELADSQPLQPIQEKSAEEKLKDLEDASRFTDQP